MYAFIFISEIPLQVHFLNKNVTPPPYCGTSMKRMSPSNFIIMHRVRSTHFSIVYSPMGASKYVILKKLQGVVLEFFRICFFCDFLQLNNLKFRFSPEVGVIRQSKEKKSCTPLKLIRSVVFQATKLWRVILTVGMDSLTPNLTVS